MKKVPLILYSSRTNNIFDKPSALSIASNTIATCFASGTATSESAYNGYVSTAPESERTYTAFAYRLFCAVPVKTRYLPFCSGVGFLFTTGTFDSFQPLRFASYEYCAPPSKGDAMILPPSQNAAETAERTRTRDSPEERESSSLSRAVFDEVLALIFQRRTVPEPPTYQ